MPSPQSPSSSFSELSLPSALTRALEDVGYETPTPIQAQTIPTLLNGQDLLGHAPTGTGKTAAFALPLLSRLDLTQRGVQVMVLTPTRELAIQVAEAFKRYATYIDGFNVLPIYGGQDYSGQIRQLKRGVQVVVGTPGRVIDHMRRGTLKLDNLQALVLDEADEMLRMGFIDDIEWILEQSPQERQLALFSATMPREIQRIAMRHLRNPTEVTIKTPTATADTINQRYWLVSGLHKLDALTRILETEPFNAILVFVRTRLATTELTERLEARGHAAAALNGDMPQKQREAIVSRLKRGSLDILIATDVAARGLDVERISHVINYDIPYDTETYIHRIGRTGRAGRTGDAILFVTSREKRMLAAIEKATKQPIEPLTLPSTELVNNRRIAAFFQSINESLSTGRHEFMLTLLQQYQQEHEVPALEIAAALASLYMGDKELLLKPEGKKQRKSHSSESATGHKDKKRRKDGPGFRIIETADQADKKPERKKPVRENAPEASSNHKKSRHKEQDRQPVERSASTAQKPRVSTAAAAGMEWFRIEAGTEHKITPANVVGTIANEAGLEAEYIGRIEIEATHSLVELPLGMPKAIFRDLRKAWIGGQRMGISRLNKEEGGSKPTSGKKHKPKSDRHAEKHSGEKSTASAKHRKKNNKKSDKNQRNKSGKKHHIASAGGSPKSGSHKKGSSKTDKAARQRREDKTPA